MLNGMSSCIFKLTITKNKRHQFISNNYFVNYKKVKGPKAFALSPLLLIDKTIYCETYIILSLPQLFKAFSMEKLAEGLKYIIWSSRKPLW